MGGIGSGRRWHYGANDTTSNYRAIDVRRWKRDGLLTPGSTFNWQWTRDGEKVGSIQVRVESRSVNLIYRSRAGRDEWVDQDYSVWLDWTPCKLGGERPWFRCPARGCGQRVAILFGGRIFACRKCYKLAYLSQRETWDDRAARRADRIRDKLGWRRGILNGPGPKPKGMHWRTFERLTAEHDRYVQASLTGIAERLHITRRSLEDWD